MAPKIYRYFKKIRFASTLHPRPPLPISDAHASLSPGWTGSLKLKVLFRSLFCYFSVLSNPHHESFSRGDRRRKFRLAQCTPWPQRFICTHFTSHNICATRSLHGAPTVVHGSSIKCQSPLEVSWLKILRGQGTGVILNQDTNHYDTWLRKHLYAFTHLSARVLK